MQIGEFTLANEEKIDRAINGTPLDQGKLKGGVGIEKDEKGKVLNGAQILAEYDRLGGLILKGKYKVRTGCFWDFKGKQVFENPKPMLVFNVEGDLIEIPADQPLPLEVQAAEKAKERKEKKAAAKKAKKGKKNQDSDEEDESSEDDDDSDGDEDEDGELA